MLLILAEIERIVFQVFRQILRTAGNRRGSYWLDRLCYTDNFNDSYQITQSEEMLIIATLRNAMESKIVSFNLASLPQFGTEEQLP